MIAQSLDEREQRLLEEAELMRRGDELLDRARAIQQRLLNRLRKSRVLRPDNADARSVCSSTTDL